MKISRYMVFTVSQAVWDEREPGLVPTKTQGRHHWYIWPAILAFEGKNGFAGILTYAVRIAISEVFHSFRWGLGRPKPRWEDWLSSCFHQSWLWDVSLIGARNMTMYQHGWNGDRTNVHAQQNESTSKESFNQNPKHFPTFPVNKTGPSTTHIGTSTLRPLENITT